MKGNLACTLIAFFIAVSFSSNAQKKASIQWITFEQLEDSLNVKPKKVFLDFYTVWCTYCRKMDKAVLSKPEVISILNNQYYAVKFDAETKEEIKFGGQIFKNDQAGKSRRPVHQIAQLLATRNDQFAPPVIIILDENFNVEARYFEYLDSSKLTKALTK